MPFPLDPVFIIKAEEKLGKLLPKSYVTKMCQENGCTIFAGEDDWDLFPVFDSSDQKRIKRTCNDICLETKNAREFPHFPAEALAIGSNGGGDLLIFMSHPESGSSYSEAIYAWDHNTGNIYEIAPDFSVFQGKIGTD